jgi:hypothetical protein
VTQPRVDRYTVESHDCVAEDTWEKLAKEKYGHENAAPALREFNRNYFRATDRLRKEGTMAPGEKVFIPPVSVLERHGYLVAPPAPMATPSAPTSGAGSASVSPVQKTGSGLPQRP